MLKIENPKLNSDKIEGKFSFPSYIYGSILCFSMNSTLNLMLISFAVWIFFSYNLMWGLFTYHMWYLPSFLQHGWATSAFGKNEVSDFLTMAIGLVFIVFNVYGTVGWRSRSSSIIKLKRRIWLGLLMVPLEKMTIRSLPLPFPSPFHQPIFELMILLILEGDGPHWIWRYLSPLFDVDRFLSGR